MISSRSSNTLVDDNVRPFEELARVFYETRVSHVGQCGKFQPHNLRLDSGDQFMRGTGTISRDPLKMSSSSSLAAGSNVTLMCRMCGNA
jgi:hypothetical protein